MCTKTNDDHGNPVMLRSNIKPGTYRPESDRYSRMDRTKSHLPVRKKIKTRYEQ